MAFSPASARLVSVPTKMAFPPVGQKKTFSKVIRPGIQFNEVIPSWNIDNAEYGSIKVELRLKGAAGNSMWYTLADWTRDNTWSKRESTQNQKDDYAQVMTDTLRTKAPQDRVELRVTLQSKPEAPATSYLKLLTLSFSNTKTTEGGEPAVKHPAWGKLIDVPQRAQGNYPRGNVLCSATSTSMLLSYWSGQLGLAALDRDVPEVEANVWDPVYKGAGNWPFNTAYSGSFAELTAYVSRLTSIKDLEDLIEAGIPVACSVSFDMLRGRPLSKGESGHLVLVVGFTEDGTPIFNDPAFKAGVRKTYPRADFEKGWNYSHRTVYIVHPVTTTLPGSKNKVWIP